MVTVHCPICHPAPCAGCRPGQHYCTDPAGHGYLIHRAAGRYPASPCADAPPDPYTGPDLEPDDD